MSDTGWQLFSAAVALASEAHAGQTDKSGAPYIEHPLRVASYLGDDGDRAVAALHDVLEDTSVTEEELAELFPADIVADVVALTHRKGEPRTDYYARIRAAGDRAVRVKLADLRDNTDPGRVAALDSDTRDRLRRKYEAAAAAFGTTVEELHRSMP